MTLSIVLPTYNIEQYITQTLDCILNQTYKDIELIIVDDCSTDRTPEKLIRRAEIDNRIKLHLLKNNVGPGAARNFGVTKATGKYLTFVDHDDWQDLNRYEKMLDLLEYHNVDMCISYANEYYEGDKVYKGIPFPKFTSDKINIEEELDCIIRYFIPPWTKICRRDIIVNNSICFTEGNVKFDDILFHILLFSLATDIAVYDSISYTHRMFASNISTIHGDNLEYLTNDNLLAFEKALEHPIAKSGNTDKICKFFVEIITDFTENLPQGNEKSIQKRVNSILKKNGLKRPRSKKLFKQWLYRVRISKKKIIIKIFGFYLIKYIK